MKLADSNAWLALVVSQHVFHDAVHRHLHGA